MTDKFFERCEHTFYVFDEDFEQFFEDDGVAEVKFDPETMEVVDITEMDYTKCDQVMHSYTDFANAAFEVGDLKDGEKLKVTMFKVGMPNGEVLSIPMITDERAVFVSCSYHGEDYDIYTENEKREATDEEIDMIGD